MFERYTESARRVIFLARHEACTASAQEIDTIDLLRGIVRELKPKDQAIEWIRTNWDRICEALWPPNASEQKKLKPSSDIPLSGDAKLALLSAAEVGKGNSGSIIDPPALLLGVLSFENDATGFLGGLGLDLERAWNDVRKQHQNYPPELARRAAGQGRWSRLRTNLLRMFLFLIAVAAVVALLNRMMR